MSKRAEFKEKSIIIILMPKILYSSKKKNIFFLKIETYGGKGNLGLGVIGRKYLKIGLIFHFFNSKD